MAGTSCAVAPVVRITVLAIVAWLALVGSANAEERKPFALLESQGPKSGALRGEVMRIAAAWVASASKLDDRSIREFADDYEVDLVTEGSIEKRAREYKMRIRFVRGDTGGVVGEVMGSVVQSALERGARKRVERVLKSVPARSNTP